MSMKSVLILIVSIGCMSVWVESQRGSYPELNPENCGISRLSLENDECFDWHKNGAEMSQITNGMNVTARLVPWLVFIQVSLGYQWKEECTGTLIANQWVLTTARCLRDAKSTEYLTQTLHGNIHVFAGHNFIYNQYRNSSYLFEYLRDNGIIMERVLHFELHPNYTDTYQVPDLALIKLEDPIPPRPSVLFNSICLPMEAYSETVGSRVAIAGYRVRQQSNDLNVSGKPSHKGDYPAHVAFADVIEPIALNKRNLRTISPDLPGDQCRGDSGSPVWQYHNGRAILLGIYLPDSVPPDGCGITGDVPSVRVSDYIDWIIHVTGLDQWHLQQTGHDWYLPSEE